MSQKQLPELAHICHTAVRHYARLLPLFERGRQFNSVKAKEVREGKSGRMSLDEKQISSALQVLGYGVLVKV